MILGHTIALDPTGVAKNHSLAGAVLDCGFYEIRRQFLSKAPIRGGRVVAADRFFPSTQICACCGALTGPKGREAIGVEEWVCRECGVVHQRDRNAAINLRTLGTAGAKLTRGDMAPLKACAGVPASPVVEPRTETERTRAHI